MSRDMELAIQWGRQMFTKRPDDSITVAVAVTSADRLWQDFLRIRCLAELLRTRGAWPSVGRVLGAPRPGRSLAQTELGGREGAEAERPAEGSAAEDFRFPCKSNEEAPTGSQQGETHSGLCFVNACRVLEKDLGGTQEWACPSERPLGTPVTMGTSCVACLCQRLVVMSQDESTGEETGETVRGTPLCPFLQQHGSPHFSQEETVT